MLKKTKKPENTFPAQNVKEKTHLARNNKGTFCLFEWAKKIMHPIQPFLDPLYPQQGGC